MAERGIHGTWASRWTFILAATGSAVGLGNIWKFPYITGENGGGAFVIVYLCCIALIGLPVMMAEVLLGRRARQSPVNAMRYVAKEAGCSDFWQGIGWMGVVSGLLIMSFYSVIAGWALHYIIQTASGVFSGASAETVGANFGALLESPTKLVIGHTVFTVMTAAVVAAGVTRGLGAVAKYMMPFLFLALIVLLVYGAVEGEFVQALAFLFEVDFSRLSGESWLVALGHAFFTLSLGMGAIMAYGAYMPEKTSLAKAVLSVGVLDTLVALVAGLAIFPIVFANTSIEPGAGPGLLFVSLPVAFGNMPMGLIFGTLFFVLVSVAAWSSAVSLIEPGVAWVVEKKKLSRVQATIAFALFTWTLGLLTVLSFNVLQDFKPWFLINRTPFDFFDFLTAQIMLPLGGLLIAIFVGWKLKSSIVASELRAEGHPLFDVWLFVLRFVSPVLVAIVFVVTLLKTFGVVGQG